MVADVSFALDLAQESYMEEEMSLILVNLGK